MKQTEALAIPKTYDKKVIGEWIGQGHVKREMIHESNYCLLIEDDENATGGRKGLNMVTKILPVKYRFIRFFTVGGPGGFKASHNSEFVTHASVDWEGTPEQAVDKLIEMMSDKSNF
jgi:hypothetical protein